MTAGWRRLLRIWRRTPAHDVDAELEFHFDERATELRAGGANPDAARAQALREFGDRARVRSELVTIDGRIDRRMRLVERLASWRDDLRYVLRSLRRSPGFTLTAVLTFALGLGANAAMFSILDRIFLSAPPGIAQPDQVHRIYRFYRVDNLAPYADARPLGDFTVFNLGDLYDIAALAPRSVRLAGYTRPDEGSAEDATFVLGDYFGVLGVHPAIGRLFSEDEARVTTDIAVVVISHRLWLSRFGGRSDVVGQQLDFEGHPYTIIGVTPGNFHGADNSVNDLWLPVSAMRWAAGGSADWYQREGTLQIKLIARTLTPEDMRRLQQAATLEFQRSHIKADIHPVARLRSLSEAAGPDADEAAVAMTTRLAGVALIILIIACANIANLLLMRGMHRRREVAVRIALGVSRGRLIRLLLAESVAISVVGGALAVLIAVPGATLLRRMLMPQMHWADSALNWHVVEFSLVLAVVVGNVAGIVPAWRSSRADTTVALKTDARSGGGQRSGMRTTLLVMQTALSVLLLTGAAAFVKSLHAMETADVGYDVNRLVFASVNADAANRPRQPAIWAQLPALAVELGRLEGVQRTALASNVPMASSWAMTVFRPGSDSMVTDMSFVSPSYLQTVGMPVVQGRGFDARDSMAPMSAIVVNQSMARAFWSGKNPVGQCIVQRNRSNPCSTVVGVVRDAHEMGINEEQDLKFYRPLADSGWGVPHTIVLRALPGRAALVKDEVQRRLASRFAGWAIPTVHLMTDNMSWELRPRRVGATLFSVFGLLALLVAIVGVYSTISYTFSQRTHEIGVRMALGARASTVAGMVVRGGIRIVMIGILIGLALSWAGGRLVESMLYHTSSHDPVVLTGVVAVLLVVAALASAIPAVRASRVDPVIALRAE